MSSQLPSELIMTLRYRPVVFRMYYLILSCCGLSLLIIGRIHFHELMQEQWYQALFKWALASSVPITILFRTILFFRPRLYCEYQIDGSKLRISKKKKDREVFFTQVKKVTLSKWSPRFLGGFTVSLNSGTKFRFLPFMENSHVLLQRMADQRPELISKEELSRYLVQAQLIDHSWARIREKFLRWKVGLVKYIGFPLVLAEIGVLRGWKWPVSTSRSDQFLSLFLLIFALTVFIAFLVNHFEEKWNQRHQLLLSSKDDPDSSQLESAQSENDRFKRDHQFELRAEKGAHIATALIVFSIFSTFAFL